MFSLKLVLHQWKLFDSVYNYIVILFLPKNVLQDVWLITEIIEKEKIAELKP